MKIAEPESKFTSLQELLSKLSNPEMPQTPNFSRKEEKQCLQNLNNRLAGYIDHVHQLQQEKSHLTYQIKNFKEHKSVEVQHIKDLYEKQIASYNEDLDCKNKQYNELKVGQKALMQEYEDINSKLKKRDLDLATANDRHYDLEDKMRNLTNKFDHIESDRNVLQQQLNVRIL